MPAPAGFSPVSSTPPPGFQPISIADAQKALPEKVGFFQTLVNDISSLPHFAKTLSTALNPAASASDRAAAIGELSAPSLQNAGEALGYAKAGHPVAAAIRAAESVPIAGPMAREISHNIDTGDYGAAGAHALELALPHVAGPALDAASDVAPAVGAAVKAGGPDVAKGALKAVGGEIVAKIPGMEWPARIGLQYPALRQVRAGVSAGADAFNAALSDKVAIAAANAEAETAAPEFNQAAAALGHSDFDSAPVEAQNTIRSVIGKMKARADTAKIESALANPAPVAATATEAPAPIAPDGALLDGVAQGFKYKNFSTAPAASQQVIRGIVEKMKAAPATEPPANPQAPTQTPPAQSPATAAPVESVAPPPQAATYRPPETLVPGRPVRPPLAQSATPPIQAESAAEPTAMEISKMSVPEATAALKRLSSRTQQPAQTFPVSEGANALQALMRNAAPATNGAIPAAELGKMSAPEALALQRIQQWIRQKASGESAPRAVANGLHASGAPADVTKMAYEQAGRAAKVQKFADLFSRSGITPAEVRSGEIDWKLFGPNKPSAASIEDIATELERKGNKK